MNKQPLLYFFPHILLKNAVLNQWDSFGKIVSQGSSTLKDVLVKEFNRLKEDPKDIFSNKEITLNSTDFDSISMKLNQDTNAIVVRFPVPTETTEVTHIAIVLTKQPADTPRYFTLELHKPDDMEKQLSLRESLIDIKYVSGLRMVSIIYINQLRIPILYYS